MFLFALVCTCEFICIRFEFNVAPVFYFPSNTNLSHSKISIARGKGAKGVVEEDKVGNKWWWKDLTLGGECAMQLASDLL